MLFRSRSMQVGAILFDLDGTIADTEHLHFEAYNSVLQRQGIELAEADYFKRLAGRNDYDCFARLLREHRIPVNERTINRLIADKSACYQAIAARRAAFFPGALEFVRRCSARFPQAVVTGTLRVEAELLLRKAQIHQMFTAIVTAEDVKHGKPAPDGFILAARLLRRNSRQQCSLAAAECLVVEDTPAGVAAAHRAGMRVLGVAHTVSLSELVNADVVRPSLAQTDLDDVLRQLMNGQPCS